MIPAIWLAHSSVIYSRIAPSWALNRIFFFFSANENKHKKKTTNQIESNIAFVTLDWDFDRWLQYWNVKAFPVPLFTKKPATKSIKYWHLTNKKCIRTIKLWDFKTGCNKVVIELRVVQFWSEIILVISNQTRAARSFDIWNHAYDFRPNCTPLSSITIMNSPKKM